MSNIGGETRHLAKRFGHGTSDVARHVGGSTADLARRVGPTRGLIALAVVTAAVGSIFLVRYLRQRAEGVYDEEIDLDASEDPQTAAGKRSRKISRAERKARHAAQQFNH